MQFHAITAFIRIDGRLIDRNSIYMITKSIDSHSIDIMFKSDNTHSIYCKNIEDMDEVFETLFDKLDAI